MAAPPVPAKVLVDDLTGDWQQDSSTLLTHQSKFNTDVSAALQGRLSLVENLGWQKISIQSVTIPTDFAATQTFPLKFASKLPGGLASLVLPGLVSDITSGSTPGIVPPWSVSWRNEAGVSDGKPANMIVIDSISGLSPNRTYSLTLWAAP